jgi:hypothetical protein
MGRGQPVTGDLGRALGGPVTRDFTGGGPSALAATAGARDARGMTAMSGGPIAQRSRVERVLIVMEVLLAVGAFAGAAGFLLAWSAFDELTGSLPFGGSLVVAGLALGLVNGVLPSAVAYGAWRHQRWARPAHVLVGIVLVVWIVVQVMILGPPLHALQLVYLLYGIALAWLGEQRLREQG